MLKAWLGQDSENTKTKAAKIYAFLKFAEFSRNPSQEKLTTLQMALDKLKSVSLVAMKTFCTFLGAPQTVEAAVPAVLCPIIAEIGIFLADNPDFWNKVVRTGSSLLTLFDILEQNRRDLIFSRSSSKPKPVVSSSSRASGGGTSAQPPEGDDGDKKGRIQRTAEDVINYFKKLKQEGWKFYRSDRSGHKAYKNEKTGEIKYNDNMHNEIECFDKSGRHTVRDPVTDELLDKPQHRFPDWLK
jgi:hypothetical protein